MAQVSQAQTPDRTTLIDADELIEELRATTTVAALGVPRRVPDVGGLTLASPDEYLATSYFESPEEALSDAEAALAKEGE